VTKAKRNKKELKLTPLHIKCRRTTNREKGRFTYAPRTLPSKEGGVGRF